ncbi:SCO family protein [Pseudomonas sp. Q1-7]|uniref:SCO family protein n=1 Tax=Pseudomonas sp. Q1-7 TaxID=3020843 RepID=UPI002300FB8E|nr:SCO family protein [Pseudomonas sp. Q1-7]
MDPIRTGLFAALFALATGPALAGHSPEEHAAHMAAQAAHAQQQAADAEVRFADVPLLDQNGRELRLKDDLVGDRIVVMGFVYTSCTTVCPVISAIMQKLQTQLGERAGREVQLISLSIDPLRDTPQRLHDYAGRFGAGDGWRWVTGSNEAVTDTLKGLGTWTADYQEHPPLIMVGDGRTGQWTRFYGFTDPSVLLARVDELSAARAQGDHARHAMHAAHDHAALARETQP